jgi:ceroid-lipofuscinosis MFS transporter 7
VVSSPILGELSVNYGYRSVLIACNVIIVIGTLIYAHAQDVSALITSQIVMGLGSGSLGVTRSYVAEQTEKQTRTVLLAYLT